MDRASRAWWLGLMSAVVWGAGACDSGAGDSAAPSAVPSGPVASRFPGAGRGAAGLSLAIGTATVSCDQPGPIPGGSNGPAPGATAQRECYFDRDHPDDPAATMEWIVEAANEGELIHARLTFNPRFVDNTYGANAVGWNGTQAKPKKAGHTFKDLVGSDHAEFTLSDASGLTKLKFKADYLSASATAASGYMSLGVRGGEGKMLVGSAEDVVAVSTSLDRNLNSCGYSGYTTESPATNDGYAPNPDAPNWDFRVVYDVWVKREAFASDGFGRASVEFVHASPSKAGTSTVEVTPGKCPPHWPPYCADPAGCELPPICGDDLDEICTAHPPCEGSECPSQEDAGIVF